MQDLRGTNHWIKTHGDFALDLVRIYLGIGLIIKGIYFATHSEYLIQLMQNNGSMLFAPAVVAHYIVLAHVFGGGCLAFGLITRLAALVQIPVLAGAIFRFALPDMINTVEGRQSIEFAGLVCFLLVIISIYGAGRWSMDYWLSRKKDAALFRTEPEPGAAK
jgi:uncharacterized membrane protein YphA (DoxX/SURF4 family)